MYTIKQFQYLKVVITKKKRKQLTPVTQRSRQRLRTPLSLLLHTNMPNFLNINVYKNYLYITLSVQIINYSRDYNFSTVGENGSVPLQKLQSLKHFETKRGTQSNTTLIINVYITRLVSIYYYPFVCNHCLMSYL